MKFLRILGGALLIAAGVICGLVACSKAGGMDGWRAFAVRQLFQKNLPLTLGCPLLLLLGVGVANVGARINYLFGALLAFGALAAALPTVSLRSGRDALPWLVGAGILAIAGAITASLGRRNP